MLLGTFSLVNASPWVLILRCPVISFCTSYWVTSYVCFLLEVVGHASFDVRGPSFSFRPFVRGVLGLIGSFGLPSLQKLVVGALYPSAHDYTSAFC